VAVRVKAMKRTRDRWEWLNTYEAKTGGDVLAIAHNGNLFNGIMFPLEARSDGVKRGDDYVTGRAQ
jgi:hypothetical protein